MNELISILARKEVPFTNQISVFKTSASLLAPQTKTIPLKKTSKSIYIHPTSASTPKNNTPPYLRRHLEILIHFGGKSPTPYPSNTQTPNVLRYEIHR